MMKISFDDEADMLVRLGSLIDKLIMTGDYCFQGVDLELLRAIERFLCDDLVQRKRNDNKRRRSNQNNNRINSI